MNDYSQKITEVIAMAPTSTEALAIWNAVGNSSQPTVACVLAKALQEGNQDVMEACRVRLQGSSLTPEEQAKILMGWNKRSTREITQQEEKELITKMIGLGLITKNAMVDINNKEVLAGPLGILYRARRIDAAEAALLMITPEQHDLNQALFECLQGILTTSGEKSHWVEHVKTLISIGADPDGTALKVERRVDAKLVDVNSPMFSNPGLFTILGEKMLFKLLEGRHKDWLCADEFGISPMSSWIIRSGCPKVAMSLGKEKYISTDGYERLISGCAWREIEFGDRNAKLIDEANLQIEKTSFTRAAGIIHAVAKLPFKAAASPRGFDLSEITQWWNTWSNLMVRAFSDCDKSAAEGLIRQVPELIRYTMDKAGVVSLKRTSEDTVSQAAEEVRVKIDGLILDFATPMATGHKPGLRL